MFGSCPHCQDIFRLSEVRLFYTTYRRDWMDKVEEQEEKETEKLQEFEEKRKELRDKAIERERKKNLPLILNRAVPMFARQNIFPQDVKTLFDPIDFVVFDGMNHKNLVKRILLMDKAHSNPREQALQESIQQTIDAGALTWKTIQISREGQVQLDE